jgi:hypothetical protein
MPNGEPKPKLTPAERRREFLERQNQVERRREFLERRNRLEDSVKQSERTADRLVVSGAAGALILSITFIHDIAPSPQPETLSFLLSSWALLALSLLCSFASHLASDKAFRDEIVKEDAAYEKNKPVTGRAIWDRFTGWVNVAAFSSLLLGLASLATFAFKNTRFQGSVTQQVVTDSIASHLARIDRRLDSIVAWGPRLIPPPPPPHKSLPERRPLIRAH